jgi:acyl-CoA synthetase (AMP-forming)/AMP-acid ligase II
VDAERTGSPGTGDTLDELIERWAVEAPGAAFLEDARSDRVVDYGALRTVTAAWRALFGRLNVTRSGAVIVDVDDPLSFALVHLAAIAAGKRSIPVDASAGPGEAARLSELIGGAALVVSDRAELAAPAGAAAVAVAATGLPGTIVATGDAPEPREPQGTGSVVLFTSGSTGTPKGVEIGEAQLLFVARQVVGNNRLTAHDRGFNPLPLFHVNAEVVGLTATLVAGSCLVLDRRFHRTGFWALVADRRITWINAVPAILAVLARSGTMEVPAAVRFIRSASAPLPDPVREALGPVPLVLSYGMTEAASQITATPLDEPAPAGSVGVPLGAEIEARDDEGRAVAAGEVGGLWIRGDGIVDHYLFGRAPERFDADGWLSTGDLGRIDGDGFVYLVGRSDDVINRGGEKVYPVQIENVLLENPDVLEAVVVPRPDPILGQVPVAFVIRTPDAAEDDPTDLVAALGRLCDDRLARFQRPVDISVVDDLPHAATGKVQRARVRQLAATDR